MELASESERVKQEQQIKETSTPQVGQSVQGEVLHTSPRTEIQTSQERAQLGSLDSREVTERQPWDDLLASLGRTEAAIKWTSSLRIWEVLEKAAGCWWNQGLERLLSIGVLVHFCKQLGSAQVQDGCVGQSSARKVIEIVIIC